jgi:hypothetical protein
MPQPYANNKKATQSGFQNKAAYKEVISKKVILSDDLLPNDDL